MNFDIFLMLVTIAYAAEGLILVLGVRKGRDRRTDSSPRISVVIAARNEEENVEQCLRSVCSQSYPQDRFEVILVNDSSNDKTEEIARNLTVQYFNLRVVNAIQEGQLRGKPNALAQGIDHASGEVILITDADCIVPTTWVEGTARRFSPEVGLVGGITLQKAKNAFSGMQSVDWAYVLGMASSTAALGYPLGSIGNNLSFRKAAYEEVGGYRNLKFSVTEDYTLVQAIIRTGNWEYLYPIDPEVLVESQPCADLMTLIRQRQRWGKGGLDMRIGGFFVMVIGFLMHVAPFVMLYWGGVMQCSFAIMAKLIVDYVFLYAILKKLNKTSELVYFYWFELYFFMYVVALPFLVLLGGKVRWKGRTF
jgi:cellulose synthase/poly-beta-1,6-N-acetylglucosamine synthase-like glycosyltransferase